MDSPKYNLQRVARFIRRNAANHRNRRTGDYDTDAMAAEAARHFDLHDGDRTPEEFLDVALEVIVSLDRRI